MENCQLHEKNQNGEWGQSDGGGGPSGNLQPNTKIGYADGDLLKLTTAYNQDTDTVNVTYSLNGGSSVPFYSGGGIDGPMGDVITNFVEVELFKFNDTNPENIVAKIDTWSLIDEIVVTPGDFNGDGKVDGLDLLIWQRGDSPLGGTADELGEWEENFGTSSSLGATAGVPEPSSILLVLASTAMLARISRARR